MTSGTLARAAGVGLQTIWFYERKGLLPDPPRSLAGRRQYADADHPAGPVHPPCPGSRLYARGDPGPGRPAGRTRNELRVGRRQGRPYLVKKDGRWLILVEIQRGPAATKAEWDALR
jgi:hypothetical protein